MALIIAIVNKSGLAEISNYEVTVYVNERKIAGPFHVKGHHRSHGWEALVKQFAESLETKPYKPLA